MTVQCCGQILKHDGLVILLERSFTFTFYSILEQFQTKPDLKHLEPEVGPNIKLLKSEKARARESQPEPEKCRPDPPLAKMLVLGRHFKFSIKPEAYQRVKCLNDAPLR
jgi:hypothetical protein